MMGCEAGVLSPTHDELEEQDLNSGMKKRHRRSFGGKTVPSKVYLCGATTLEFSDATQMLYIHVKWHFGSQKLWMNAAALVSKYCFMWFGLSRISDMVSGALNKIKTNRTPTNATQSERLGRYWGQMSCCCLSNSMKMP